MAGKKATPKKKVEDSEAPHMPTSTPKRVNRPAAPKSSPTKSTPAKLKSRATSDESLLFLYHCLRHNGGSQVDYAAVGKEFDISKNASYKRFMKLKTVCEELDSKRAQGEVSNDSALESAGETKGQVEDPVKEGEDLKEDI